MIRLVSFALAAAIPLTAASAASAEPSRRLLAMTPERFGERIDVHDDPLEHAVIVSTERGHRSAGRGPTTLDSDPHLRAVVDRATGVTRYEVRHLVRYYGPRRTFVAVNYAGEGGVRTTGLSFHEDSGDHCSLNDTTVDCIFGKTVAFGVDEALLRGIAARYAATPAEGLRYKLKEAGGRDVTAIILPAEAAALLARVDEYRARVQRS